MQHHARHLAPQGRAEHCCARDPRLSPRTRPGRAAFVVLCAFSILLPPLLPQPVRAAEGLYLNWNDCALGPSASSNRDFACDTNNGQSELICAFTMPQAASNVVAVEIVVDVQHSSPALPDWWQLSGGGCRGDVTQFNLTAAADFPGLSACLNLWQGAPSATALMQGYIPSEPRGADSQARIKVTGSVLSTEAVSVDGTSMYYAARIILSHNKTVGSPSCAGCGEAACLVMNSILIGRLPDPDIFLQMPGPGDANWARWQGGAGANCAAVPVRNRAWGQLKGLYR